MIQDWSTLTLQALQVAWENVITFLPTLLAAIVVFIIGWIISIWIGKIIARILSTIKFDELFSRTGWKDALEKAEIAVSPSDFIGAIVKWILVIVFLLVATDILQWSAFASMLQKLVLWLPNLIIAIIILVVAIVIADILEKIMKAMVKKMGVSMVNFLGSVIKVAIYVFAVLAALSQLEIAPAVVNSLITGFIAMLALALGLSFGLGGKDMAARLLEEARRKIENK
ncbi:MAG: hypothetical protein WC520_00325 [Candidatus Paceibacterota bacterium]